MCINSISGYSVDSKKAGKRDLEALQNITVSPNIALLAVLNFCDCTKNACTISHKIISYSTD